MQDNYVSLEPTQQAKQALSDREILYRRRYIESAGGPYARGVGTLFGLTASTYMYVRAQRHGFPGFFPLSRLHAGQYVMIVGSGLLAAHFFNGLVGSITGDTRQQAYLLRSRNAIL